MVRRVVGKMGAFGFQLVTVSRGKEGIFRFSRF